MDFARFAKLVQDAHAAIIRDGESSYLCSIGQAEDSFVEFIGEVNFVFYDDCEIQVVEKYKHFEFRGKESDDEMMDILLLSPMDVRRWK